MSGTLPITRPALRRSLQVTAALMLSVVMLFTGRELLRVRDALVVDRTAYLERLTMAFADQLTQALAAVDVVLRDSVEQVGGAAPSGSDWSASLRRRMVGVPQILDVAVLDENGKLIAGSRLAAPTELPTPGLAGDAVRFGDPFRLQDGRWAMPMRRTMRVLAGGRQASAVAWLDLGALSGLFRSADLEAGGSVSVFRDDGVALVRFPQPESGPGPNAGRAEAFQERIRRGDVGTASVADTPDGVRRLVALKALRDYPLLVQATTGEGEALAAWRTTTFMAVLTASTATLVIGALLLVLTQRAGDVERLVEGHRQAKEAAEAANAQLLAEIDERAKAESALRDAQRIEVMGQLTGAVAHDFNNLLTVLLGNLDLIEMDPALAPRIGERIAAMRGAAERGEMLTGQLLAFSRRQTLRPERVELGALVLGLADLMRSAAGSRIRVEIETGNDLPAALVDPHQLELVLMNLVINARDAMPEGGTLVVATSVAWLGAPASAGAPPAGDYVVLRVRDTGAGMTPEVQARALEPFFTTKGPGGGAGLGLSQVYGVARQSGGGVRIESAPGRGTSVWVYLPVAGIASPGDVAPARELGLPEAGLRVLLVDDDEAVRVTTALLLKDLGFVVTAAADSLTALGVLDGGAEIDVLVSDIAMPGMPGAELAARAGLLRPGLPVVFLSGHADPSVLADGMGAAWRLVRKPFRPAELAAEIAAAVR